MGVGVGVGAPCGGVMECEEDGEIWTAKETLADDWDAGRTLS